VTAAKTSIVVPLRNEAGNLAILLGEIGGIASAADVCEIILADDASSDQGVETLEREHRIATQHIRLAEWSGQSAAMHAGMHAARGSWIVTADADLQNDPADIPTMLELARTGDYDLVCGWRQNVQESSVRKISSNVANCVRRAVFGDPAHDTGCTLKVMKSSFAKRLPNWDGMHRFIPTYAAIWALRQTEMPVGHRPRLHGESKTRQLSRAFAATRDLFFMLGEKRRAARAAIML
jgi:dolichol-phosphate mannosyltransferase